MEIETFIALRNLLVFGIFTSAACFQPETSLAVIRPFLHFWRCLKLYRTSIAAKFRPSRGERFWEIDLTKFEP